MQDVADLGFRVDPTGIAKGIDGLDKLDDAGERAGKTLDKSGGVIDRSMRKAGLGIDRAKESNKGLLNSFGLLKTLIPTIGLAAITTSTLAYAGAVAEVSTLVDTSVVDMGKLSQAALEQSRNFGTFPTDNVNAFYQAISAGAGTVEQANAAVDAANRLAIGGVTDVTTAVDGLTSVMNAYNGEAGTFTDISDSLFVAVKAGKTTVGELAASVGNLAPIAAQTGVSFNEVLAATAALTKGGVTTTTSMNGIRAVLAATIKPTKDAADEAARLGLQFDAAALKSKGFTGFLADVQSKTGGSTESLAKLFGGVEALVPIMALAGKAGADYEAVLAEMATAAGATDEAFTKMANSPGFQIDRIIAGVSAEILTLTSDLANRAVPMLRAVADSIPVAFAAIHTVINGATSAYTTFRMALTDSSAFPFVALRSIGDLLSSIGEFLAPIAPLMDEFGVAVLAVGGGGAALGLVAAALVAIAQVVLSPIVLGIAAIAAGAVLIRENWDSIASWWTGLWSGIQLPAESFHDWWENTNFTTKIADIKSTGVALAQKISSDFVDWWQRNELTAKTLNIITTGVDMAIDVAGSFFRWWDNSGLADKSPRIIVAGVEMARDLVQNFAAWWNGSSFADKLLSLQLMGVEMVQNFVNWWNNTTLTEKVADVTSSTLQAMWDQARRALDWWNSVFHLSPRDVEFSFPSVQEITAKVTNIVTAIATGWASGVAEFARDNGIVERIEAMLVGVKDIFMSAFPNAGDFTRFAQDSVSGLVSGVTGAIAGAVAFVRDGLVSMFNRAFPNDGDFHDWAVAGLVGLIRGIGSMVGRITTAFMGLFSDSMPGESDMSGLVVGLIRGIGNLIIGAAAIVKDAFVILFTDAFPNQGDFTRFAIGLGMAIVDGVKTGLGSIASLFAGWITDGINTVKELLGIRSPSTVFRDIAMQIVAGFIDGIKALPGVLADVMRTMLEEVKSISVEIVNAAKQMAVDMVTSVKDGIKNAASGALDAAKGLGSDIGTGLSNGLSAAGDSAKQAADAISTGVLNRWDTFWERRSPSRVAHRLGFDIAKGKANGLTEGGQKAVEAAQRIAERANQQFQFMQTALVGQGIALTQGADAARMYQLSLTGMTEAQQKQIFAAEKTVQAWQAQADAVKTFSNDLENGIVRSITNADSVKDAFSNLGDWMRDWLKQRIAEFAANKILISLGLGNGSGGGDFLSNLLGGLSGGPGGTSGGSGGGLESAFTGGLDRIASVFNGGINRLGSFFRSDFGKMGGIFGQVGDKLTGAFNGVGSMLSGAFGGMGDKLGGIFGGVGDKLSGAFGGLGGQLSGFIKSASPALLVGQLGTMLGEQLGAANAEMVGALAGLGTAIAGPIGSVVGGIIGSAFGGSRELVASGFEVGIQNGAVGGQSFDQFERERSLWRGTQITFEFSELDARVSEQLNEWFTGLNTTIVQQAQALGVAGADSILDGYSVAVQRFSGENAEEDLQMWLEESTRKAYVKAFQSLGPELQSIVSNSVDLINAPVEDIEGVFMGLAIAAQEIVPMLRASGAQISESFDGAIADSFALMQAIGSTEEAMSRLGLYFTEFVPAAERANTALQQSAMDVVAWNQSIGQSSGALIDTREEFHAYIGTLDLTTKAGQQAAATALEHMEAIIALDNHQMQQVATLHTVGEAATALNLNFDRMGPGALQASEALVELFGGIEGFTSATQSYYSTFFSAQEQQNLVLANAAAEVQAFNSQLGLTGDAVIDTKDEFRAYVESLDLTTEAGRKAFAAAMGVAESMGVVVEAGQPLADTIASLPENLQASFGQMQITMDDTATMVTDTTMDIAGGFQSGLKTIEDAAGMTIKMFEERLGPTIDNYTDKMDQAGNSTAALTSNELHTYMANLAAQGVPLSEMFNSLPAHLHQAAAQMASDSGNLGNALFNTTGNMSGLKNALNAVNDASYNATENTKRYKDTLAAVLADVKDRNGADGSFASGLGNVPFDGFKAITHKNEAIFPANVMSFLRTAGIPVMMPPQPAETMQSAPMAVNAPLMSDGGRMDSGAIVSAIRELMMKVEELRRDNGQAAGEGKNIATMAARAAERQAETMTQIQRYEERIERLLREQRA